MPLASRAELESTNSFIFNEMSTLPLYCLLARDGHLDEGQNVSFTRWGIGGMRVGGRKPGRESVLPPTLHNYGVSLDAAMRTLCRRPTAASDPGSTICYNGPRS